MRPPEDQERRPRSRGPERLAERRHADDGCERHRAFAQRRDLADGAWVIAQTTMA